MVGNIDSLWAILYVSSAIKELSTSDVEYFLTLNRKSRSENNITGIVLFSQNNVLVIEEGLKDPVKAEFEKEKKHPAHHSIIKLFDGPIQHLFFESFPLAFKTIGKSPYSHLDDFATSEQKEYFDELLELDTSISKLIRDFIKNNS